MKKVCAVRKNVLILICAWILSLLFAGGLSAQEGQAGYGFFSGALGELAPRSVKMEYAVNDPPGTFENYDTGVFSYKYFDVDPATRLVKGNIQLGINATKWTRPLPGRKNYDYSEKRTDHTGGYMLRAKMTAGNIDLDASLTVGGALVNSSKVPDVKALLHEMAAKIPKKP